MVDFSQLLGQQPVPGLLSQQQQGNATSQGIESLAAGLIKAGGPSEYKNNFSGIGDAIQGGLDAYNRATTQQLQSQYIRGQINKQTFDQTMMAMQTAAQYRGAGLPVPPELQALLSKAGVPPHPDDATAPPPAGPAPMPAAGPAPAGPPPGLLSPPAPQGPGPVVASNGGGSILPFSPGSGPPQIMPSGGAPAPAAPATPISFNDRIPSNGGMPAGLLSAPGASAAPAPQGPLPTASMVQNMPVQDRYALIGGGPVGKIVEGVTQKNLEQTDEGKNARDPMIAPAAAAVEGAKADATAAAKLSDTIYKGITGSASIAAQQKQNIDVLRQIAASPGFTPGAGSDLALSAQRLAAQFGINPAGAAPRELFNQLAARVLADQMSGIKSMASETGEAGGRIFKPMLDIEEKANVTPNDSLAGVNAKLNMLDKAGDLMMKWGDMADDYHLAHGHLDPGFYKQLRQEIGGARIGNVLPPAAAPTLNKAADVHAAIATGKLKSGDSFTDGNGVKRVVP
jgi:hypothetical protein